MSIPVLMYHHVLPKSGFIASSIQEFEEQMYYLAKNGWTTLTSQEFYLYKKGLYTPPTKSVFITFDDGWKDNFVYAYPILKKFGLKATLFLVTEWVEKSSEKATHDFLCLQHKEYKKILPTQVEKVILSWNEIEQMSDIFDFHSHTHTHRDSYFSSITWEEEFVQSKKIIEKRLGLNDLQLCWPRGKYDLNLVKKAQESGFEMLYTTERGVNTPNNNLLKIKRIATKNGQAWLGKNLFIFSNNLLGHIYSVIKK